MTMEKQQTTKITQTQQEDGVTCRLELLLLLPNVNANSCKIFLGAKTFSNLIGA